MPDRSPDRFFDTVTLSNFVLSGAFDLKESELFVDLLRALGSGEASCSALARLRDGVVATDDRTARGYCADWSTPVTGSIGILKALCIDHAITPEEADIILDRMVVAGFYSPVRRISDLL